MSPDQIGTIAKEARRRMELRQCNNVLAAINTNDTRHSNAPHPSIRCTASWIYCGSLPNCARWNPASHCLTTALSVRRYRGRRYAYVSSIRK